MLLGDRPRKSLTRGKVIATNFVKKSHIRWPLKVTFKPTGIPCRTLKTEMDFLACRLTGFCPLILVKVLSATSATFGSSLARPMPTFKTTFKIFGTAKVPRLNVSRSLKHIFLQLIDDQKGKPGISEDDIERDLEAMQKEVEEGERFFELWNLVFMQYNRSADGTLTPLPKPSVDTGMGLERLSAVVQKVKSNYDSDLLKPIITYTEGLFEKRYGRDSNMDISFRVIADHSRSMTFLIGDGVMPSNEGRGYVLRRIIRRASRHGRMLGKSEPFLFKTSDVVIDLMKDTYPELLDRREYISKVISTEEERFSSTLDFGMKMLNDMVESLKAKRERLIAGEDAFKLYDTYGFPLDLTEDIAKDSGLAVDSAGFNRAMEVQKERARASWKGSGEEGIKSIYRDIAHKIKGTQSLSKPQRDMFIGYDTLESEGTVLLLIKGNDMVKSASEGEQVEIVLDKTPFYGESGGQVGDTGKIWNDDTHIDVLDTKNLCKA